MRKPPRLRWVRDKVAHYSPSQRLSQRRNGFGVAPKVERARSHSHENTASAKESGSSLLTTEVRFFYRFNCSNIASAEEDGEEDERAGISLVYSNMESGSMISA